jgi:hypothetical protein
VPYEAVSAVTIDCGGNALLPGGFGFDPSTFVTIVPGAEWSVRLLPIDGPGESYDIGTALANSLLAPVFFFIGDPALALFLKLIPGPGIPTNILQLRVCGPDLITPAVGGFIIGTTLLRRVGPPSAA